MMQITRAQQIFEILGTTMEQVYLSDIPGQDTLRWETKIGSVRFRFEALYSISYSPRETHLTIIFSRKNEDTGEWETSQISSDQHTTMRVFSSLIAFTRAILHKLPNVTRISFSAKAYEQSRVDLYNRLAHILARQIGGTVNVGHQGQTVFYVVSL